ncbi:MAG: trigger factor [Gammaproteobacteria bacterium]|jgi:trigger factor|nr:trigger factor [Gammaproteobacteria bacterium]MDP6165296.1 trigger factor [Gammaproteobacteria bacterium]
MQVSVEATTSLERRVTVTVPADKIDSAIDKKVQETSKTIRIDGFRKGKVPAKVVKKRYGASIRQEVLGDVIQTSYFEALQEADINPAGMPEIEPKEDAGEGDFSYVAVVEVYPEIALADASALSVERQAGAISDTDVDNMIEMLRKQQTEWTDVERASADGDQVNIDFEGFQDGEAFDGGAAQGHDLVLGSNSMIPGFEEGIVGMSTGEEKAIQVTFPEDYQAEHLAGKEVTFNITANKVSEALLPELNDEFFAKFGPKAEGEEGFKSEIRANMEREMSQALKAKLKNNVLDAYLELNEFDIPKALVKGELDRLKQQAMQQFGGGDQNQNLDPSILPDEMFQDQADKRVKVGLLAGEIIKANEMKADEDKVKSLVEEMAQGYQDPQEFVEFYLNNAEQRSQLEGVVLEEMVVDHLLASGNVTDVEVDYETAIKPAEQADA